MWNFNFSRQETQTIQIGSSFLFFFFSFPAFILLSSTPMSKAIPLQPQSPEYKGLAAFNIIYEAGLDNESRPILILCADNLPDPNTYDYDLILSFIMGRLGDFVENDYVLVFFASPARYRPGWFWLLRAYRSLDRRYKKNLKALHVVHLNRAYRFIFDLANKIISPKFARKLRYNTNLAQLNQSIVLDQRFIPQRVVDYDKQLYQKRPPINTARRFAPPPALIFGKRLEDLAVLEKKMGADDYIPDIVIQITDNIRKHGLEKEGIFRKSPSSEELQSVKAAINRGEKVDLSRYDIDVSTALLKVFIRELPEPLISLKFSEDMGALPDASICTNDTILKVKSKLATHYQSKSIYYGLLKFLCHFLKEVAENSMKNRMNIHNLSVVFTPNIIRSESVSLKNDSKYIHVPDTQQSALADAALYLQQMNQGMILIQLLVAKYDPIFS
ncbi:Rho GTPase activation protein [Pilobolus umbonatus]|nr:Rho GTPase activation protein [Pilobolus umbonatus]